MKPSNKFFGSKKAIIAMMSLILCFNPTHKGSTRDTHSAKKVLYTSSRIEHKKINKRYSPFTVTATSYFPCKAQCDNNFLETASGKIINSRNPRGHRWIALSHDFFKRYHFKYGDSVYVKGAHKDLEGYYVVQDLMNSRYKLHCDILVNRSDKQFFEMWKGAKLYRVRTVTKDTTVVHTIIK